MLALAVLMGGCPVFHGGVRVEVCSVRPGAAAYVMRLADYARRKPADWAGDPNALARYQVLGTYSRSGDCLPSYASDYTYVLLAKCGDNAQLTVVQEVRPTVDPLRKYEVCR